MSLLLLLVASADIDIDALFDAGRHAERAGDCETAGARYFGVLERLSELAPGVRAQVESQVHSRLKRTEACRAACTLSPRDAALFETAKSFTDQPRRLAALCQELLRGKDTRCKSYAAIRDFCPAPPVEIDPCASVPKNTVAPRLAALMMESKDTHDLDVLVNADHELAAAHEQLVDLRERSYHCDKAHQQLVATGNALKLAREEVASNIRSVYRTRVDRLAAEVEALKKDNKHDQWAALSKLNDELLFDLLKLAGTQALTGVVVEGSRQRSDSDEEALSRALRGEREALDALIREKPELFGDGSRRALENKRAQLERLDTMLARYAVQGKGNVLGFERARNELQQSLVLVDKALLRADARKRERRQWAWLYIFGIASAIALTFVFARRSQPA